MTLKGEPTFAPLAGAVIEIPPASCCDAGEGAGVGDGEGDGEGEGDGAEGGSGDGAGAGSDEGGAAVDPEDVVVLEIFVREPPHPAMSSGAKDRIKSNCRRFRKRNEENLLPTPKADSLPRRDTAGK